MMRLPILASVSFGVAAFSGLTWFNIQANDNIAINQRMILKLMDANHSQVQAQEARIDRAFNKIEEVRKELRAYVDERTKR